MNFQLTVETVSPWRRRGWLALIGAAHLLAVWGWRTSERAQAPQTRSAATLTYILTPTPPRPLRPAAAPLPTPQAVPSRTKPLPAVMTLVPALSAPVAEAPVVPAPPVDPLALPSKPLPREEDALQRARRSAGAVDRQLRKEAWNPRDKRIANDRTLLAEKLGSAYRGSDGVREESVQLDDGRVMTKVHTPGGSTYCAVKESNGLTGGRDPFRDGIRTKVTTCGR